MNRFLPAALRAVLPEEKKYEPGTELAVFFVDTMRQWPNGQIQRMSGFVHVEKPVRFDDSLIEEISNDMRIKMDNAAYEFGPLPHISCISLLNP